MERYGLGRVEGFVGMVGWVEGIVMGDGCWGNDRLDSCVGEW